MTGGSSLHHDGSAPTQFAGPEFHPYTGQDYVELSSAFMRRGCTPLWDEEVVLHEESHFKDFDFDQGGSGPSHSGSSQVLVWAS